MIRTCVRYAAVGWPVLQVPLVSEAVAAGWPSPAQDYIEGAIDLNEHLIPHPAATFIVRAAGRSMEGVGIFDGDELVVDRSITASDGHVVIVVIDGEFLVKTLRIRGAPRLVAASPGFPDILLAGRDAHVWGVVTCVLHHLPL